MLEVSHLSKIYKTKGGADVKALDDISLRFPEKGMVFLLGKSGSGKSTLLNVCGGLDDPSAGEIIVKGRSSKNFSQSDFDSYRNTFIGFIFQEYNILNEFSVEENIALALELQGKTKDKEAVARLLAEVDLTGYAKRKPNTLSGGQKQRIAIARALIKSPEIIMADEPTGALDSATGKQVFDTLKKLSHDKLVIVVSHDREFAEQYGDRVIELKDGKILSDVSKTHEERKMISEGVSAIGETLCIKKGTKLNDKDFATIKEFLLEADSDVLIASGDKDVKSFKAVNRITDEGEKEVFRDTDEKKLEKKAYKPEDSRFIRSKLPIRHAIRIGGSGLKTKPFRLTFTVLLCTVAFVLFGVLSTMTFYDSSAALRQTLTDSSLSMIRVEKQYKTVERYYNSGKLTEEHDSYTSGRFHPNELDAYKQKYGEGVFGAVSAYQQLSAMTNSLYYQNALIYFAALDEDHPLIHTALPGSSYPDRNDEIWLSTYMADVIINSTIYDAEGNQLSIQSATDLIGKVLPIGGIHYTVTGVFDSGSIDPRFDALKEGTTDTGRLQYEFSTYLADGLYQVAFLSQEALKEYTSRYGGNDIYTIYGERYLVVANVYSHENGFIYNTDMNWSDARYCSYNKLAPYISSSFFGTGKTSLSAGETLVPASFFYYRINTILQDRLNNLEWVNFEEWRYADGITTYYEKSGEYINGWDIIPLWHEDADNGTSLHRPSEAALQTLYTDFIREKQAFAAYEAESAKCNELMNYASRLAEGGYWNWEGDKGESVFVSLTDAESKEYHGALMAEFGSMEELFSVSFRLFSHEINGAFGEESTKRIVGVYRMLDNAMGHDTVLVLPESEADALFKTQCENLSFYWTTETQYKETPGSVFTTLFLSYDHSQGATDNILALYESKEVFNESDWTRVVPRSAITEGFESVDSMVSNLKQIFLYVGLVLAVFAALLLSNFISVSISHKKREIGILRAVGARSFDVFKIFFSESFIISAICVLLSLIGSIAICGLLNAEVSSMLGVSLFVFGFLSFVVLIGVALLTAIVATFLPVYNAAKKKPVDSIRAL